MAYTANDFIMVSDDNQAQNLFKFAAFEQIKSEKSSDAKKALSLKYQVLCEATSLVGIIKQEGKSSLESKEVVVNFTEKPKMYRRGSTYTICSSSSESDSN